MKTSTFLVTLALSLITFTVNASPIAPQSKKSLYDHMVEVNKEWTGMQVSIPALLNEAHFDNDVARIQTHLSLVEHILRQKDVSHLSCSQQENRLDMLQSLRRYWQGAQFPVNTGHLHRQPYFIDNFGTACAVGHLLQESGFGAFAEKIRTETNFAYIREMKYEEIPAWAEKYGFSIDELAWIQPGYNPQPLPWTVVGNGGGPDGVIHTMYKDEEAGKLYIAGNFNDMDGTLCTSIVSWDGTNWEAMGGNFEGEIHAIEKHNGKIHIGGDFMLFTGAPWGHVAVWDEEFSIWQGLQVGFMEGRVLTMKSYKNMLYIGGDFMNVGGQNMFYWAAFDDQTWQWSNFGYQPSGPVRQFELVGDNLALAGDFQVIGSSTATIGANYLAFWDGTDWSWVSDGTHNAITAMRYFDQHLFLADDNAIFVKSDDGNWTSTTNFLSNEFSPIPEGKVFQFQPHNNNLYAVGNFFLYPDGVGFFGRNMIGLSINPDPLYIWADGAAHFDTTVTAAASFDNKFYAGGLFEDIDLNPFNKLAATELGVSTSVEEPVSDNLFKVYFSGSAQRVIVQYENLAEESAFAFYDIQGRAIHHCQLQPGSATFEIPTDKLVTGTYVYQVLNSRTRESGKVTVVK